MPVELQIKDLPAVGAVDDTDQVALDDNSGVTYKFTMTQLVNYLTSFFAEISSLGTMSLQNANAVNISGGDAVLDVLTSLLKYTELSGDATLGLSQTNEILIFTTSPINLDADIGLAAFDNGFTFYLKNISGGNCTFTPKAGEFIDGQSVLTLGPQAGYIITKSATQWSIQGSNQGAGGGANTGSLSQTMLLMGG